MINLLEKYKKYKICEEYGFGLKDCLSREMKYLEDSFYYNKMLKYSGNNYDIVSAAHSSLVYKKIHNRYRRNHSDKFLEQNTHWEEKTLPKKIWWCWLQGEKDIPELPSICLKSLRRNLKDYKINIITLDNLKKYVVLPEEIYNKYNIGWISGAQFSDIIRLALLAKYGGIWIDSTVYCTDNKLMKIIENNNMFMFQNVMTTNSDVIKMSSWLMASKKQNPYIVEASRLLIDYHIRNSYTEDYFLCHLILTMLISKYQDIWNEMDILNNINPHVMQYMLNKPYSKEDFDRITRNSSFHKLNRHIKFKTGNTIFNFIRNQEKGNKNI